MKLSISELVKVGKISDIIDLEGYAMPDISNLHAVETSLDNINTLAKCGISISAHSHTNVIYYNPDHNYQHVSINFGASEGNIVIIEPSNPCVIDAIIFSTNGLAILRGSEYCNFSIFMEGDNATLYCGPASYIGQAKCWVGANSILAIGEDAMMGWDVGMRTADFHGVFDLASLQPLNPPRNTIIGPHVWLSHGVNVMKGTTIGAGSIIGAGSFVTKTIPGCCSAAGTPAVVQRHGISWSRRHVPPIEEMASIRSRGYIAREISARSKIVE